MIHRGSSGQLNGSGTRGQGLERVHPAVELLEFHANLSIQTSIAHFCLRRGQYQQRMNKVQDRKASVEMAIRHIRLLVFNDPPLVALPVPHVHLCLPIASFRSRVQCQVLPYTTCIPDTRREQGGFTDLRMGHYHLFSVLPRRPALRPLLVFHPFCRWCCSRIHSRTVVCFTPCFTHQ